MNALLTILLLTGLGNGAPHSAAGQARDQENPVDLLLRADALDDSAVGEVTQTARAVRTARYNAFRRLYLAGKTSSGAAKRLVDSGSPAGRVYGYLILRHVSAKDAADATQRMLQDKTLVAVRNGCEAGTSTVRELVAQIQKGVSVIQLPK